MGIFKKKSKPKLSIVPLYPNHKAQIGSLEDRLKEVIDDYTDQERKMGRSVTVSEIIGTVDLLKDRLKDH